MINQHSLIVDFLMSDLSIHLQSFWHKSTLEASQEGITNLRDVVSICSDLGHTPSVTIQDTRYLDRRYWSNWISQSNKD